MKKDFATEFIPADVAAELTKQHIEEKVAGTLGEPKILIAGIPIHRHEILSEIARRQRD